MALPVEAEDEPGGSLARHRCGPEHRVRDPATPMVLLWDGPHGGREREAKGHPLFQQRRAPSSPGMFVSGRSWFRAYPDPAYQIGLGVVGESIATVSLFSRLSFVLLQHSEQPPSTGLSLHQRLAGAFTTGFYILHVRTHNLWSVRIQAPVRFEWAIKLRVPLPTPSRRAQAGVPAARSGPARPGLRPRSWVGLGAATQACGFAHLFPPLLIPMSHLPPPKTNFRTAAATWLGWPKTRMEEAGDPHPPPPEDHSLGPPPSRRSPDASRLLPPSWFGPKPSSGILRGTGPPTWDPQHPHL
ncbi:uncharacterized protein LOC111746165 [Pteropus vampyrus]|uniref:Uncharacterized protein LOC111746165 n=1 Tax=Pteropus vampyrus TaxID=132908 RepID=A0A6P6D175_PTEVA|nr:uncharacterized protein LOC111746165 [Pteropus vampyrus]